MAPKTTAPKLKSRVKADRPHNRYMMNAKLSEHRFLRVLRTFIDWRTPSEAAKLTGISERTIRSLFNKFRQAIVDISLADHNKFGGLGLIIYQGSELSARGKLLLGGIQMEESYYDYLLNYGARPDDNHACMLLLWERAARLFCLKGSPNMAALIEEDDTLPTDVRSERLEAWLVRNGFPSQQVAEASPLSRDIEQMEHILGLSKVHRRPDLVMFHDIRRSLLKRPLN